METVIDALKKLNAYYSLKFNFILLYKSNIIIFKSNITTLYKWYDYFSNTAYLLHILVLFRNAFYTFDDEMLSLRQLP